MKKKESCSGWMQREREWDVVRIEKREEIRADGGGVERLERR
jgi:hypothetical protein